jgi:hypothetical protein
MIKNYASYCDQDAGIDLVHQFIDIHGHGEVNDS